MTPLMSMGGGGDQVRRKLTGLSTVAESSRGGEDGASRKRRQQDAHNTGVLPTKFFNVYIDWA